MIHVGIDPGLDGAIALIGHDGSYTVKDTPTLTVESKTGTKREYDLAAMRALLAVGDATSLGNLYTRGNLEMVAAIEAVHAMPGQGVRSMFTMGYGLGVWEAMLAAFQIPYTRVTPQRWKKTLLDGMGHDKDAGRVRAMQLFPNIADLLKRKKDDGRADALLIAEYGRRVRS